MQEYMIFLSQCKYMYCADRLIAVLSFTMTIADYAEALKLGEAPAAYA